MARRKKKSDPINDILFPLMFIVSLFTYIYTRSWLVVLGVFMTVTLITIMIVFLKNNKKKRDLKRSGISTIDTMDGLQFEKYLALLFKANGYKAKVTKGRGDFGADLVLHKDGETIVAQAKRYSKNVGIKAVQEVTSSIKHYKANRSLIITNSYYTKSAIELAKSNEVELIDRNSLMKMLQVMNPYGESVDPVQVKRDQSPMCDSCREEMVIRQGKNGEFYGCVNFPTCKVTKTI